MFTSVYWQYLLLLCISKYTNACYADVRLYIFISYAIGLCILLWTSGALLAHLISESCLIVIWNSICTVYKWIYMYWWEQYHVYSAQILCSYKFYKNCNLFSAAIVIQSPQKFCTLQYLEFFSKIANYQKVNFSLLENLRNLYILFSCI